jgi:hypothetical protein
MNYLNKQYCSLFLWMLIIAVGSLDAKSQERFKSRNVYDNRYLSSSGIVRIGDLFKELPFWNSFSIDGFTHFSNNSFSGVDYSRQTWSLFIDGRVIDHSVLGFNDLNILPYTLDDLDSIEVFQQPIMISGVWAGGGAIHLHTKKSEGVQLNTQLYLGNEVDDPGPFIYTELEPVNIDRIGPDFSSTLRLGTGDFYTNIGLHFREHHSTDSRISARTKALHDLNNRAPRKVLQSSNVRMGYQTKTWLTEWGLSSSLHDDFPYLPTFGAEIPMSQSQNSVYLRSQISLGSDFSGFVHLTRNEDHLKNRFNYLYWDPALKVSLFRSRIGFQVTPKNGTYLFGLGNDVHHAKVWLSTLRDPRYSGRHLFFSGQQVIGKQHLLLQTDFGRYKKTFLPKISFQWSISHTELNLSYNKRSTIEEPQIWYWMDQGYNEFSRLGPNVEGFQHLAPAEDYVATFSQGIRLGSTVQARFLLGFRSHQNDWAVQKEYLYEQGMTRFLGDLELRTGITGSRRFWGLTLHHNLENGLSQELSYVQMQTYAHSDDVYKSMSKQFPELRLQYRLHYTYSPGFSVGTLVRTSSPTQWYSFDSLDPNNTPNFDGSRIPNQLQWDVFAKKTLFDHRIWTSFRVENILDRPLQEWPIGEIQHMTLHLSLGMKLGNNRH